MERIGSTYCPHPEWPGHLLPSIFIERTDHLRADEVGAYLDRIRLDTPSTDLEGLRRLQHAHLTAVPFENLDIALGSGVDHTLTAAIDKVVHRRRGGWCFELNGAFSLLLRALGFDVRLLGAAVLLDGPNTRLDHLVLEVSTDDGTLDPHLVDVGFGDSATEPIPLNRPGAHPGGVADFELLASPQGTTLARLDTDGPRAEYRFKRVAHDFHDFAPIAHDLQNDPDRHWSQAPFATRLTGRGTDRVTLLGDRLRLRRDGGWTERPVASDEWSDVLAEWFSIDATLA
ncbi:MAG: arylamine N-acetyltransferase [Actinomycetota bacterium]